MIETPASPPEHHPGYGTFVAVWIALVLLTTALVLLSHHGQAAATWGLLTLTPLKAALVFYYFMHLKYEGILLKAVVFVCLATLIIFFALLFSDVAFRERVQIPASRDDGLPRDLARKDLQSVSGNTDKGPDNARRAADHRPEGLGRRASPGCVRLVGRCPASPLLAFHAWLARRSQRDPREFGRTLCGRGSSWVG